MNIHRMILKLTPLIAIGNAPHVRVSLPIYPPRNRWLIDSVCRASWRVFSPTPQLADPPKFANPPKLANSPKLANALKLPNTPKLANRPKLAKRRENSPATKLGKNHLPKTEKPKFIRKMKFQIFRQKSLGNKTDRAAKEQQKSPARKLASSGVLLWPPTNVRTAIHAGCDTKPPRRGYNIRSPIHVSYAIKSAPRG